MSKKETRGLPTICVFRMSLLRQNLGKSAEILVENGIFEYCEGPKDFHPGCTILTYKNLSMTVNVGDKAPNFTLRAHDKSEVSLEDYRGKKVILLFFPLAYTGVCTTELCSMRDDISFYDGVDAQVLAVSVDSLFVLDKFREDQKINFPLLSDFNKKVSRAYGSLYEEFVFGMKGVAKRSAFVIDKEGIIRYAEVLESAGDLPNFEKVKATLSSLD